MADESPQERALDEMTREVAAEELEQETVRESSGPLGFVRFSKLAKRRPKE
jgi:hypothetical protein